MHMVIVKKIYYIIEFIVFYLFKLTQANIYIAYDILTPTMHTSPELIKIQMRLKSDAGMLLFSNLVTMTPGTLSIDITEDRKYIIIHVLYGRDKESVIKEIDKVQNRVKRLLK